jgi:hypothetical protein
VQSARELNQHQISIERQELQEAPKGAQEELALIYQSKGLGERNSAAPPGERRLPRFSCSPSGPLSRYSHFIFTNGFAAVLISLALSVLGLFGIGAGVSLTAGSPLWKAGARQILLGLLAAGITFGLGKLIGTAVG